MIELFDWQRPLAAKLIRMMRAYNCNLVALPTGSGKTFIATDVTKRMHKTPLVICPKSAVSSWKTVCESFEVEPAAIINWEKLKTGKTSFLKRNRVWEWALPDKVCVIIDEVHRGCSGIETQIGTAAASLRRYNVPVMMMSATMASNPMQLRHSGYLLGLHGWTKDSFFRWCMAHGCKFDQYLGHWVTPKGRLLAEAMQKIRAQIPDRILHMQVSEIPGFPETIVEAKLFDLDNSDTTAINKAWTDMTEHLKKPGVSELAELMKARHRTEWIKCGLLCELIKEKVDEGTSVVVFMNFKDTVDRLKTMLETEGLKNLSVLTGDSNDAERVVAMNKFQANENHVFICTTGAGGVAISLHDVKQERPRLSYVNPSYSASETVQALGRIRRAGGTNSIQIFPLIANTIEERVFRAITSKCRAIETLNDGDLR